MQWLVLTDRQPGNAEALREVHVRFPFLACYAPPGADMTVWCFQCGRGGESPGMLSAWTHGMRCLAPTQRMVLTEQSLSHPHVSAS
eukprot:24532-Rhodomonas_salina.1